MKNNYFLGIKILSKVSIERGIHFFDLEWGSDFEKIEEYSCNSYENKFKDIIVHMTRKLVNYNPYQYDYVNIKINNEIEFKILGDYNCTSKIYGDVYKHYSPKDSKDCFELYEKFIENINKK